MRLTVAAARPAIAKAANLCATDSRVIDLLNRGIQRLLPKGNWVGTIVQYRICTNSGCLTWPRQIETIEAAAVCDSPITIRNGWFEFLGAGNGLQRNGCGNGLIDMQGQFCTFDDITANSTTAYIKIYADVPESGKYIILQGYDENGNWIRTQVGADWIDGEKILMPTSSATPATTTKKFSSLTAVIKDKTNGVIRLYEFNGTSIVRALSIYEPDETLPCYRRSRVGAVNNRSTSASCEKVSVTVMAKLAYVPVEKENDFLLLGCLPALEEMTRALKMFDAHLWPEAYACEARAVKYLDDELNSYQGSGEVLQMRVEMNDTFSTIGVENIIGGSGFGSGIGW